MQGLQTLVVVFQTVAGGHTQRPGSTMGRTKPVFGGQFKQAVEFMQVKHRGLHDWHCATVVL